MSVEKLAKKVLEKGKVDDLILLEDVNEGAIVANIKARFQSDLIYTSIGPVLISMNPFKTISGLYTPGMIKAYSGAYSYERAPHVYSTAEETFRALLNGGRNQCVLVSGESGAGKTEATKKILEYISAVSNNGGSGNNSVSAIKDKLLESNPVMEAFGNAKTLRNDNSSRFGKYMVVDFDFSGVPLGAMINQYLLEKPRVVKQSEGERNFHIFYFLLAGASPSLRSELALEKASHYEYTKGTPSVKSINDESEFNEVDQALNVLLGDAKKKHMYSVVAAVLQIGNISFKSNKTNCDASGLDFPAKSLQVDIKALGKALTFRTVRTLKETVSTPFKDVEECIKSRDALAKALYSRAFKQLVAFLNESLSASSSKKELQLGLLDIFGFEIFQRNSFEQLLINYTNERLQQIFVRLTLESEQAEYAAEGLPWQDIPYFNNQIVCDLIDAKKPAGIIAYCDEESIIPNGSDKSLLNKMNTQLKAHKHYEALTGNNTKKGDGTEFLIKHYAGDVMYSCDGFLEKNMDLLYRDLVELIGSSRSSLLSDLFPEAKEKHDGKKPISSGSQFRVDMQNLVDDLMKCDPHYVRCIKPNDNKQSGNFQEDRVAHQVRYLGLLENVRVRRAGFAYRHTFKLFVHRYQMICPTLWLHFPKSGDLKRDAQAILDSMAISGSGTTYALGKTKIFIKRPETLFSLEEMRERKMHDVAQMIQSCWKAYLARLYFLKMREKSLGIFNGKKRRRGSWILYFQGDYIHARNSLEFKTMTQTKFQQDEPQQNILFADQCEVLGKKHKLENKYVVFTTKSLYVADLQWKSARRIDLQSGIASYSLSTFADGFLVISVNSPNPKKPEPDLVMYSVRKAEILTLLNEKQLLAKLEFKDEMDFRFVKKGIFMSKMATGRLTFKEGAVDKNFYSMGKVTTNTSVKPKVDEIPVTICAEMGSKAQVQLSSGMPSKAGLRAAQGLMEAGAAKKPPAASNTPVQNTSGLKRAKILYDHKGPNAIDLQVKKGDEVFVISQHSDGWWDCQFQGKRGMIPGSYGQLL